MPREKAAALIGTSVKTLQRAEGGLALPRGDFLLKAAAAYGRSLSELDSVVQDYPVTSVSRETRHTVTEPVIRGPRFPAELLAKFDAFTREMIRAGASDREIDFLMETFWRRETRLLAGEDQVDLISYVAGDPAVLKAWDELLDDFRTMISRRIARRVASEGIPPIKPKDVPAAVAKRKAELDAEDRPKRRTK